MPITARRTVTRMRLGASLTHRIICVITALCLIAAALADVAHFDIRPESALTDEPIAIVVSGLAPGSNVVIGLRGWGDSPQWSSTATFVADANGVIDLTRMAPVRGDYEGVDGMGLFWSTHRDVAGRAERERRIDASMPPPEVWHLSASVDGALAATASVTR